MRPKSMDEFVGQRAILGPGKPLRQAIESDRLFSFIFYGPPGTGKTSLARIIAARTNAEFVVEKAISSSVAQLRERLREAADRLGIEGRRTVLFVDEIHRFNRNQQDVLLDAVEVGTVTLVGAMVENPRFTVSEALLSRVHLFPFAPLDEEDLRTLLARATVALGAEAEAGVPEHISRAAAGDARKALTILEMASAGQVKISLETAVAVSGARELRYDREGDNHYDTVSAFIKSMRGSDPDASLYWLVRMLEAGEDPRFVARRMMILAAEDVGLADPRALSVATAAAQSLEMVGLPEAELILAEAVLYLAKAPKSNSATLALGRAKAALKEKKSGGVPRALQSGGRGEGYIYPHDHPGHWVEQQYLPDGLEGEVFYEPSDQGEEAETRKRLKGRRRDS